MFTRPRKAVYAILAALGVVGGAATITAAATNPNPDPPATATVTDVTSPTQADEAGEGQDESPRYTGSITVAEQDGVSEADEAATLQSLATISADQASVAATESVPGTVVRTELDNENGSVVYSVEVDTGSGVVDVKVDAGNGAVLAQDTGEDDDSAATDGPEADEGDEADAAAESGSTG